MPTKILMRRGLKADLPSLDEGEYGLTTDTKEIYVGSSEGNLLITTPSGAMMDYAGTTAPPGWMMCDGSAISRTTYANLFAAIGTSYGTGNGSTTFNLPDFRGRFPRYNDNMGTAAGAANRDTGRVHGSAQTQATARNGLGVTISNTDLSHTHLLGTGAAATAAGGNFTTPNFDANGSVRGSQGASTSMNHNHGVIWSGDAETRPINLSCNRIIKI
jgi:microcystin-dependent protein